MTINFFLIHFGKKKIALDLTLVCIGIFCKSNKLRVGKLREDIFSKSNKLRVDKQRNPRY